MSARASVVIPAHNEARGITRTLSTLLDGAAGDLDVVVVCNGCTDDTAAIVRAGFPGVRVLEIPEASKAAAVDVGNRASDVFPRVHLDADVRLTGSAALRLVAALEAQGVLAAAPGRILDRSGASLVVRWYYDVWERLPQVRDGLFGRGVFALSAEGQRRVSALPRMMSDDLVVSEAFAAGERVVVDQVRSEVAVPRRTADLIRRRVRAVTGNAQADAAGARSATAVTRPATLVAMARREPMLLPKIPVFLAITVAARLRARRAVRSGDFSTWLRDESSRA